LLISSWLVSYFIIISLVNKFTQIKTESKSKVLVNLFAYKVLTKNKKMRKIVFILSLSLIFTACKNENSNKEDEVLAEVISDSYKSFGSEISAENALTKAEALEKFNSLKPGDTLDLKFASTINIVCKMKGCWMILELPQEDEVRITFKDYGFFVPKDSQNTDVIVEGKAFLNEMSVEDQKHYAEDEGKSEAEIAAITFPEITKAFIAKGVLLKE